MSSSQPNAASARPVLRRIGFLTFFLVSVVLAGAALRPPAGSAQSGAAPVAPSGSTAKSMPPERGSVAETYGKLPLSFEANVGQTDGRVRFIARGPGYQMFLTTTEAVLALREVAAEGADARAGRPAGERAPVSYRVLRMKLVGAKAGADAAGLDELPGKYNYFIGDDAVGWRKDVPVYAKAEFRGVYEGVNLVYYGNQRQLEYDFQVAPGADPRAIRLRFEGAERVEVTGEGDLLLKVRGGEVSMRRPVIYQSAEDGARRRVEGRYVVRGKNAAAFEVGAYDRRRPLVIDPVLSYATYLGAGGNDTGYGIAVGADGSAYVTGESASLSFPAASQNFISPDSNTSHAFVAKLNPAGSGLVYSTLIGGGGNTRGSAIALDPSGSAYITGRTNSTNFPVANALRGSSNLVKSTDAGGSWASSNVGLEHLDVTALAVDSSNRSTVYAVTAGGAGIYKSTDSGATWNALKTGFSSAAVLDIDPHNPSTLYAAVNETTYTVIKSTDGGATWARVKSGREGEKVTALAIDPGTPSTAYVATQNNLSKTTDGGASWSALNFRFFPVFSISLIAVDPSNSKTIYLICDRGVIKTTDGGAQWVERDKGLGDTRVSSFIIDPTNTSVLYAVAGGHVVKSTDGAGQWVKLVEGRFLFNLLALDPSAPSTLYAGTFGEGIVKTTDGGANWTLLPLSLSTKGVAALAVGTPSIVYAALNLGESHTNRETEAFVTKLSPAGNALAYSTYLGGMSDDEGAGIAVDSAGQAYVTGTTRSSDFPVANPRKATLSGWTDAFVTKLGAAGNGILYSTYLGGGDGDTARGIAIDSDGNAYVTGVTISTDFPTTPGVFQPAISNTNTAFGRRGDAFVTKLDPTGSSFVYSTYLGGSKGNETGFAVAADAAGNAYVAGETFSADFPTTPGAFQPAHAAPNPDFSNGSDAFVTKLNPTGSSLVYSTYLGGSIAASLAGSARGIAVAPDGAAVVVGSTDDPNFPITDDSLINTSNLFRSTDGGRTWSNRNVGLSSHRVGWDDGVWDVAVDPQIPTNVYAATPKGLFKSTSGGTTWAPIGTDLPCCIWRLAVSPKNSSVLYGIRFTSSGGSVYKSTDGGASWTLTDNNREFNRASVLALDPVSPNVVYVGDEQSIWKSTDGGASWQSASAGIPPFSQFTIAIDPANPSTLYASVSYALYKSTNGGGSWSRTDADFPPSPFFGGIETYSVAINASAVFAATRVGVLKSTDGGTTWTVSLSRLQDPVSEVVVDPQKEDTVYLASPNSHYIPDPIYKSTDGGATWQPTGGPPLMSHRLAVNSVSTLFALTRTEGGRGFITKLSPAGSAPVYSTLWHDAAFGVALDTAGNAYVTGQAVTPDATNSHATPGAYQNVQNGLDDAFVAKFEETFSIGGTVTGGGALPVGVRVTLTGDELRDVTTGADGGYFFDNLRRGGNYNVTASKAGFTFAPPSYTFNNLGANQTADFSASASAAPFYTISGRVTGPGDVPLRGIAVKLIGSQPGVMSTDVNGSYSFNVAAGGDYTVTPSASGLTFTPPSRTFNGLAANTPADFTAVRQDIVVTTTNDYGAGSLRQAIADANSIPGRDRIVFNIPGAGVKTITPEADLPYLSQPVVIDATTQPGYAGTPLVELDGRLASDDGNGLHLTGGDSVVRGLAVFNYKGGSAISLVSDGNVVEGCYLGLDAAGNGGKPNETGVMVRGANNLIGGTTPAARNVISGNSLEGIAVPHNANQIKGNLIGADPAGGAPPPNTQNGIVIGISFFRNFPDPIIDPRGNQVGGDEPGAGNLIVFNRTGVGMLYGSNNVVRGNSIFSNALLGLDLVSDMNVSVRVTRNDPLDRDEGANHVQNFPVLTYVSSSGGTTLAQGTLNSTPNTQFRIDFYSNLACDDTGYGEGARPFGSATVTTDESGEGHINAKLAQPLAPGRVLTATATDPAGNTSEFSPCDAAQAAGAMEYEFADYTVLEDVGSAIVTVARRGGSRGAASVNFATAGGTATAGTDYTAVSGTLNFADGETAKTFTVPIADDGVTEPEETVRLVLGGAAEPESLGGLPAATLHIRDSNESPSFSIDFPDTRPLSCWPHPAVCERRLLMVEGDAGRSNGVATVKLSAATSRTITIDYATSASAGPESATPGVDFEPVSGSLTFAPGVQRMQILIPIIGDTLYESYEGFNLSFNSLLANDSDHVGILIYDDDPPPTFSVGDLTVVEGAGAKAVFSVRLSEPSSRSLFINYTTADGTATADADYRQTSGQLTFDPGETVKTIEVPITSDAVSEADENFTLKLLNYPREITAVATITESSSASLLQFGAAAYGVSEADHFANITVTRAGDTSGEASVGYATRAGTASERFDFTTTSGRLRFGAGETSKTFRVLVTDDAFKEPAEALDLLLSDPAGATLGGPSAATLTITSDDAEDGPSPVKAGSFDSEFFVRQHYADFLNREPDASGLQFWTNEIEKCGSDNQCREVKRINVSAAFFLSIEFQETGYLVYRFYKAAFGDINPPAVPVPVRLRDFLVDSQEIGRGVRVGIGAWRQQLEENKNSFAAAFVARPRFTAAFPQTLTAEQFVDRLNDNAGGPLSQPERDALVGDLSSGAKTRAQVLRAVAEDADLTDGEMRRAFVLMQYFGYLRRNPDAAPDTDFRGWRFWLDKLEQHNGNYVEAEMIKAFISSDEYVDRFGERK